MLGIDSIAQLATDVIDKIWPSPEDESKRMEAKAKLLAAQQAGELKEIQLRFENASKQLDVNKEAVKSKFFWVSGARPYILWVCGTAFAWTYIGQPMAAFVVSITGHHVDLPQMDMGTLIPLMLGMLGLGGMDMHERSKDKSK